VVDKGRRDGICIGDGNAATACAAARASPTGEDRTRVGSGCQRDGCAIVKLLITGSATVDARGVADHAAAAITCQGNDERVSVEGEESRHRGGFKEAQVAGTEAEACTRPPGEGGA